MEGTRRGRLIALRDSLEAVMNEGVGPRDMAAISREYRAVMAELDALPSTQEVSAADEIAERRSRRRAGSAGTARAHSQG